MILQHPTDKNFKKVLPAKALMVSSLLARGWINVTPPPTAKQIKQRRKFMLLGDLHRAASNIRSSRTAPEIQWSAADKSMLAETEQIIRAKIKRLQSESI